ncbi:hypothetical protein GJ496_007912 [Pomphorhynchus laevis]|nr:hypothetical protein GJ496_007912 [Pomphorhynchus laevis]
MMESHTASDDTNTTCDDDFVTSLMRPLQTVYIDVNAIQHSLNDQLLDLKNLMNTVFHAMQSFSEINTCSNDLKRLAAIRSRLDKMSVRLMSLSLKTSRQYGIMIKRKASLLPTVNADSAND